MKLATFIRSNLQPIVQEWEDFARSLNAGSTMTNLQLKDHIEQILQFIADDLETTQTAKQQFDKSRGMANGSNTDTAAQIHGTLRHEDGFDIVEMVSEYRALRASILRLWMRDNRSLDDDDVADLTRFNEAIDQALAESVVRFSENVDQSKDLLLGVLGHDIRSPLATIHMSAQIMKRSQGLPDRHLTLLTQIEDSTTRVRHIVTDLLDLAKAKLGTGLPLHRQDMSLSDLALSIIAEIRIQHPDRKFVTDIAEGIAGSWDPIRLGQVFSNLLGNAVQYGEPDRPITFRLTGAETGARISVHNYGPPIPPSHLDAIFQSFTRAPGAQDNTRQNLGLGLFISKEIVSAHKGDIRVASSEDAGTTFSLTLPFE